MVQLLVKCKVGNQNEICVLDPKSISKEITFLYLDISHWKCPQLTKLLPVLNHGLSNICPVREQLYAIALAPSCEGCVDYNIPSAATQVPEGAILVER
jgi:hypothetical protein